MQPLIDADVLRYEVGFAAEAGWQQDGVPPFDYAAELLDMRIQNICGVVGATAPPILYLTGKHNFRTQIATRQPYKDRPSAKPWHFYNLTAYMKGNYDVRLTEGLEADDLMAIEQCKQDDSETENLKASSAQETKTLELFLDGIMVGSWEISLNLVPSLLMILDGSNCLLTENLSKVRVYAFSTHNVSQVTGWTLLRALTVLGLLKFKKYLETYRQNLNYSNGLEINTKLSMEMTETVIFLRQAVCSG